MGTLAIYFFLRCMREKERGYIVAVARMIFSYLCKGL